jgi:hypothetical protein
MKAVRRSPTPTRPRVLPGNVAAWRAWSMTAAQRQLHSHFATAFTAALLVLLAAYGWTQYLSFQANLASWDVLFISGLITFIVGFRLALSIPARLQGMLVRLQTRQVLACDATALSGFEHRFESRARAWGWRFAALVATLLILANLMARSWQNYSAEEPRTVILTVTHAVTGNYGGVSFFVILAVTGAVAGNYIGRIVLCGLLTRQVQRAEISVKVQPGHVDGCAGLKPIGDFYFYQAMVTALPALFIGVWLLLFPVWTYRDYSYWREPYLGLLLFAVAFEALAFIVPVWTFHRIMVVQKEALLQQADTLSVEIARIESDLASDQANLPRDLMKDQLTYLAKQYQDIEDMPTWPVSAEIRTRFTVNNLVLLLPYITHMAGIDSRWPGVGKILSEIGAAITSP